MASKRNFFSAVVLSATVGLGGQALSAQSTPGGAPSGPASPGQTGPTVPQPSVPREIQPTDPGQPAPGAPGQSQPFPGQEGTIPEIVQPPGTRSQERMVVSSEDIKKAQEALKAKGHEPGSDGIMDAKTQQALRDFQKSNDLPVTGVLDENTAAKLGVTLSGDGKSTPQQRQNKVPQSGDFDRPERPSK